VSLTGKFQGDWDLNRDLSTFGDSIWTIKIRFKIPRFDWKFDLKFLPFDLKKEYLNRDKSAAYLPTQSGMHDLLSTIETLLLWVQLNAKIAL